MGILGCYSPWQNRKGLRISTYSILVCFICFDFQNGCDFEFYCYVIPLGETSTFFWLLSQEYAYLGERFLSLCFKKM